MRLFLILQDTEYRSLKESSKRWEMLILPYVDVDVCVNANLIERKR